jgi:sugar transferase (PEP-CTERM/EpsH1 system associated)
MRVLFVTPRFPFPPLKGDQVIAYHRLRALGHRHEITLLSLVESADEAAGAAELEQFCSAVHTVTLPRWRSYANVLLGAPRSPLPLQLLYYHSAEFGRRLHELCAGGRFDVVHAYFHRVAPYCRGVDTPKVLELMDSMQLRMARYVAAEPPPKRWLYREELRRITPYERAVVSEFDHVLVVSEQDKQLLPGRHVSVLPNGVDTDHFVPRPERRSPSTLVFSGNMHYEPNMQAVTWFVQRCLPLVRAAAPDATLVVAGADPHPTVAGLARYPGVRVTGFVPSMPDVLNHASVAVAPMQSGSGIQNKVLEAMACGLPVVASSLALGGIGAQPGRDLVVADGEQETAEAVVALLEDARRAAEMGESARAYVVREHSWERAGERVEEIYRRLTRTDGGSAPPARPAVLESAHHRH